MRLDRIGRGNSNAAAIEFDAFFELLVAAAKRAEELIFLSGYFDKFSLKRGRPAILVSCSLLIFIDQRCGSTRSGRGFSPRPAVRRVVRGVASIRLVGGVQ
jgi:hypothetical protein